MNTTLARGIKALVFTLVLWVSISHAAIVQQFGLWKANGFRKLNGDSPADVGGVSFYNLTVVTNGANTATLHFTNGVLMSVTAP